MRVGDFLKAAALFSITLGVFVSCGTGSAGTSNSHASTPAVSPTPGVAATVDCTASSSCSPITVIGDSPSNDKFHGYADATIRKDPQTGTLWMAYSWPHTIASGQPGLPGTQVLDIHVASSTDGGMTWHYKGALYTSSEVLNPVTGQTDYTANEVMNLYPQVVDGTTYWYGIHAVYDVPLGKVGSTFEPYSTRWELAFAPGTPDGGPMALSSAAPEWLGEGMTNSSAFPVAVNLSSLNPEVSSCQLFFEPALVMSGNNLYLFLSCVNDATGTNYFYAVFNTLDPQSHAPNWQWSYVPEGPTRFANHDDASIAGTHLGGGGVYITQMDIAPSKSTGRLLAIFTVANVDFSNGNANGKIALGCVAAELASIDPPRFVYNQTGQIQIDAAVRSTDSVSQGPGSCTYSPDSATGLIIAHKLSRDPILGFYTILEQTGLRP